MQAVAERVTETGVLVNGEWLNFSKFGKKPLIESGKAYEFTTKSFKDRKYIQSAKEILDAPKATEPAVVARVSERDTATSGVGKALVVDFNAREDAKNRRILIQGILQACLQSPGLVGFASSAGEYLEQVEKATQREVDFVNNLVR